MHRSHRIRTSLQRFLTLPLLLLGVLFGSETLLAQAVVVPGVTPVGSSAAPVNVAFTLPSGSTIASVNLLGQGSANVDFANNGGTCVPGFSGSSCSLQVVFTPQSPGVRNGAVVLLDAQSKTIATRYLTGSATGSVGVFVPGIINTVAGDYNWVYAGDGGPATLSSIFLPFGIAVNAAGDLFIADSSNNRIRRVDGKTGLISTYAGNGIVGATGDNGPATAASLNNPTSLALDAAGNLFVADSGNELIRRVDAFSGIITTFAGVAGQHGYSGDHGPATAATFNSPNGISFDANGNLYLADTGNHVIRLINVQTGVITTVAGSGVAGFGGDGGPATNAFLNAPWSATPIPSSTPGVNAGFYIADQNNGRIRKVDASGNITTIAGGSPGYSGDGGPAASAQLYEPASVLVDVAGNIYIADSGNNVVRRIAAGTGIITTYAGNNTEVFSGDGGPASSAGLYGPYAFALDTQGSLYIADVFHNRIRKVSANYAILNYPVMRVDRVSLPLTQKLENDGNAPLDITKFNPVSNSQLDPNSTTCSPSTPLAVLTQCIIGVDFAPTTTGNRVIGELDVDSDAGNSPGIIVLSGQVLDVNPTTIAITSNQNPSVTGSPVIFSMTVTSSGQTPTGTVTVYDGTTSLGTTTLGSGGTGAFTTSTLTAGSHAITAQYGGDSQNATATSPVLTQVVHDQQAATATTLTSPTGPTPAGAPVAFTATVNVVTPNSGSGAITGSVAFKLGPNVLGTTSINNATATASTGVATISLTNLPVGTDSVVAIYAGNSNYIGSTSEPFVQTVSLAVTRTTLTAGSNPAFAGAPLILTANVTSNGGVPTGSVNFVDGTTSLGTAPLNAQGTAMLSVAGKSWNVGNHNLVAIYNGDTNDGGSTSQPLVELINIAPTTTTLSSSLNPVGLGANITFTANVTSQGGVPSGTVQFFDGTTSLGSGSVSGTGTSSATATLTDSTLAIGIHNITAVYSGDSFDAASTSTALPETVNAANIAATLLSSANPAIYAAPLVLTAQISGNGSTPTGSVVLNDGATAIATLPVPLNGTVQFINPTLAIGPHTLTAAYSGDTNHTPTTSAPLTETILQGTTTALTSSVATQVAGKAVTLTAVVVGVSGKPLSGTPAGAIRFTDGGTLLGSFTPDATGTATYTSSSLLPGQHTITAAYSGDSLDAASTSATITVTVNIASTTTSVTPSGNPVNSGSLLTLTANVVGNGGNPTGTVTFLDGGSVLTTTQLTANGTATFSVSTLAPGIHQLSASYSGDPLDSPSTSTSLPEQIVQKTAVTLTSSENPALLQDNVLLTINVSNGAPTVPPTGSVTLTDGTNTVATLTLAPSGTATFTLQAPTLGSHSLVASYAGDNNNSPAASQPLVQTVTLRPSTVSFIPSVTFLSAGQQVTLISVVQTPKSGAAVPTGTVTWVAGSTTLGSAAIDATGLASLTISPAQGVFATTAQYSGDALYAASNSSPTTITVGPTEEYTIAVTPPSLTIVSGSHASLAIGITTAKAFSDTLSLGCAGLPIYATCTFSTNHIPVGAGATTSLSVMVDTGDPLGAGATARLDHGSRPGIFDCALPAGSLLALLLGISRRRLRKFNPKFALIALILTLGAGSTLLTGCSTSFSEHQTPAGSYTFQIIASGDKTGVTQTQTVQLTVTK